MAPKVKYIPAPREIKRAKERIQNSWNEKTRQRRMGVSSNYDEAHAVPLYSLRRNRDGVLGFDIVGDA